MHKGRLTAFILAIATMGTGSSAGAGEAARSAANFRATPAALFLAEGKPVLAPMAHVVFCAATGGCRNTGGPAVVDLTERARRELARVNRAVNHSIRPKVDRADQPLGDRWSIDPTSGDCEDFALSKQARLEQMGWPAGALRLAVGRTVAGEGHAVLVVRTSEGDVVLDNRTDHLQALPEADIRVVKIQSGDDPRRWRAPLVNGG